MSKRKWYDLFGIFYKTKQVAEMNRQLNEELTIVRHELNLLRGSSDRRELEEAKREIETLRGRLEKISLLKLCKDNPVDRKVGRPRIKHVKYSLAVDLDTDLALKVLQEASGENWTRLVNYIIRDWLYDRHPECYEHINRKDSEQI